MILEKWKLSHHQESSQKSKDPKELWGPWCKSFYQNAIAHCKSSSNHIKDLCQKIRDLKMTTHDELLRFVYKDFGTHNCTIKKFTSNMKLLAGHLLKTKNCLLKKYYRRFFSKNIFSEQKKEEAKTCLWSIWDCLWFWTR